MSDAYAALEAALRSDVDPLDLTVTDDDSLDRPLKVRVALPQGRHVEIDANLQAADTESARLLSATFFGYQGDDLARLRRAMQRACSWAYEGEVPGGGERLSPVSRSELRAMLATLGAIAG